MKYDTNESTIHNKLKILVDRIIRAYGEELSQLREVRLESGGTFMAFVGQELPLRHFSYVYNTMDITSNPVGVNFKVTGAGTVPGEGGQVFKFKDSVFHIDESMHNIGDYDKYHQIIKKMINPKFIINIGVKLERRSHN